MPPRGTFAIPHTKDLSTGGARAAYRAAYGEEWPHGDDVLRSLAWNHQRVWRGGGKCAAFVKVMRENSAPVSSADVLQAMRETLRKASRAISNSPFSGYLKNFADSYSDGDIKAFFSAILIKDGRQ